MVFFEVLQFGLAFVVFVFVLFQVVIPIWNGTLLFPSFRAKVRLLDKQLREARNDAEIAEAEEKLRILKKKRNLQQEEEKGS